MSSLAQEESRSISENVKWGYRKRFADGRVAVPFTRFLGFDKGPDGNLVVNERQARTVRYIFSLYLRGLSPNAIARKLEDEGFEKVTGGCNWHSSTIAQVLRNEKYKGDALLQKTYTPDFLTKKAVLNKGEVPQYYVKANHEAIIPPDIFDMAQQEAVHRRKHVIYKRGCSVFIGRIRCGLCGADYGPKIWHSNTKYRKVVWQCNERHGRDAIHCKSPNFSEDEFKALYVQALNKVIANRDEILRNFQEIKEKVFESTGEIKGMENLEKEKAEIIRQMEMLTKRNASVAMDQDDYILRYTTLSEHYAEVKEQLAILDDAVKDRNCRRTRTELFLNTLRKQEGLVTEFSDELWYALADHVEVFSKDEIRITFRNGMEVRG